MYKVSDTGWLCYRRVAIDDWVAVFKLTPEQLEDWKEFHREIWQNH